MEQQLLKELSFEENQVIGLKHLNFIIPKIQKILIKSKSLCLKQVYEDLLNWRDILSRYSTY